MKQVHQLILDTTGEVYPIPRLRTLPLDPDFGNWSCWDGPDLIGILWAMRLSQRTARILAFSVSTPAQGGGLGGRAWNRFAERANAVGIREVQLEVRDGNEVAIELYTSRGLRPVGRLEGFYGGERGWLMRGPLRPSQ